MPIARRTLPSVIAALLFASACDPGASPGDPGFPDDGIELSDEEKLQLLEDGFAESASAATFAGVPCTNTDVCTGDVPARQQCFAASSEASFRFQAYQTFNVTRDAPISFVRLLARRLFAVPSGSPAVLKVELRELTAGAANIDGSTIVSSGTVLASSIGSTNSGVTVTMSPTVTLSTPVGTDPRYVLVASVEGGKASLGLGCTDAVGIYADGSSAGRKRIRISGTSFTVPAWPTTPRDLSFAIGLSCVGNRGDCDGLGSNACEIDLVSDPDHCGACGASCSGNNIPVRQCSGLRCTGACAANTADCNGDKRADGCETNTANDHDNCGSCGNVCDLGPNSAAMACIASTCEVVECIAPFADCDTDGANGCEVNTTSSALHCGACGAACSTQNVSRVCSGSSCQAGTCTGTFDDCNTDKRTDGCETDLASTVAHCGACGNACSANNVPVPACSAGNCTGTCATNFGDCNTNKLTDGCETDLRTTHAHCGTCGNACTNTTGATAASCAASACKVDSCSANRYDLDSAYANGCECDDTAGAFTCETATTAATLTVGQSATVSGVVPVQGVSDWYAVAFPLAATFNQRGTGTPSVTFDANPNDAYRLEFKVGSCAAANFAPGGSTPPFTSFSYVDNAFGATETPGGVPTPCNGSECTATAVSTACPFASGTSCAAPYGTSTYCAVANQATCGCNYQNVKTAYSTDTVLNANFVTAANGACNFPGVRASGPGSYSSRTASWPATLYVRVIRKAGAPNACSPYTLRFAR